MPAKKFKVGIIGHTGRGDYGHAHDVCWLEMPEVEIVGVADPDDAGRQRAMTRTKTTKGYADFRELMDKEKPDIVAICARHIDQHRDMFLAAAQRGIHGYMEKPFCRTLKEADEIIAASEKHQVKLAIAHAARYSPKLNQVRKLIDEGMIGDLLEIRGRGKEDRRGGGEDMWVLGSHLFNLTHQLAGEPEWCFATVEEDGHPVTKADVVDGPEGLGPLAGDAIHAVYGLPNGVRATFDSVRNMGTKRPWRFAIQIMGSRGVIDMVTSFNPEVYYLPDQSWCSGRSGVDWVEVTSHGIGKTETLPDEARVYGNVVIARDLIQAIQDDRLPECNVYEARWTLEFIMSTFESHRTGGRVEMPLKTRENPLGLL